MTRNLFEQNDKPESENEKTDKLKINDPTVKALHSTLPELDEGHEYAIAELPNGSKVVVVVDSNKQVCTCGTNEACSNCTIDFSATGRTGKLLSETIEKYRERPNQ